MSKIKNFLGSNLKLLRAKKKRSQDIVAFVLKVSRGTLNSYENGFVLNPPIDTLMRISEYFKLSIDILLKEDLRKLSEDDFIKLENNNENFISGKQMRVLATTVDGDNNENIEMVPIKAKAGYAAGFRDTEFIAGLPSFQLPFLHKERKYRSFQIEGDSMLPIEEKSYIVAEYLENWNTIKDGDLCIVVTLNEGPVFKVVFNQIKSDNNFLLKSLNHLYKDYTISIDDVVEVWKYKCHIGFKVPVN